MPAFARLSLVLGVPALLALAGCGNDATTSADNSVYTPPMATVTPIAPTTIAPTTIPPTTIPPTISGSGTSTSPGAMRLDTRELKAALAAKDEKIEQLSSAKVKTPRAPRAPKAPATIDDIVAKQAKNPPKWMGLGGAAQVEARTAVGQDEAAAIHEVAVEFENVLSQLMAFRHSTPELASQTLMLTAWEFYNQVYGQAKPKTNPNPFQKKAAANGASADATTPAEEPSALEEVLN